MKDSERDELRGLASRVRKLEQISIAMQTEFGLLHDGFRGQQIIIESLSALVAGIQRTPPPPAPPTSTLN